MLHLNPYDGQQFLEVEQRAETRYDLVGVILVSCAGMAENDDHSRLSSVLYELKSGAWTQGRRVLARSMPIIKLRMARKAAKPAAGQGMIGGNKEKKHRFLPHRRKLRKKEGQGREEQWKKGGSHGMESDKVMGARRLGAVSRTMS